jgi:hypothetical protein
MIHVGDIEELSDGGIDILPGLVNGISAVRDLWIVRKIEGHRLPAIRTIIVYPVKGTVPVLMRKDLG